MNTLAYYYQNGPGPMMDGWNHDSWVGGLFGLFFMLLLVVVAIFVIRALMGHNGGPGASRDPLDIAKERYAKGEITKDELAEIKKELK